MITFTTDGGIVVSASGGWTADSSIVTADSGIYTADGQVAGPSIWTADSAAVTADSGFYTADGSVPQGAQPFPWVLLECEGVDLTTCILRWGRSVGAAGYDLYINGIPQRPLFGGRKTTVSGMPLDVTTTFNIVPVSNAGNDSGPISNTIRFQHASTEIENVEALPWLNAGLQSEYIAGM